MNKIGDFYWAYADILRGIGINESMYDQRILAFMALKLLVDNNLVQFNFDYKNNFNLSDNLYQKYKASTTKETLENIIKNITNLGTTKLKYFKQNKKYNPLQENENILYYINHKRTFPLLSYIDELPNDYLEMVLDIYINKADFKDYPKEFYKDLYEKTISRMKKLSGDLTGQHFTQKSIIHLMCEYAIKELKDNKKLAIYDPTCGTGSMLMESYYYFKDKLKNKNIKVYGQEMHGQTWLLAKIFLEISQIQNIIAYGNTLTNPAFDKINGDDSFDFIIANPPFGVDWKHDYNKVIENMKKNNSNFLLIKDEKEKIITPKKSDGQFLFMLHILKLLENSKKVGKKAKAVVISSTGLISSGKNTSAEGQIRKQLFQDGWVDVLLEQPKAMFTNTDIPTLIWFFDNTQILNNETFLVKIDNKFINNEFKNKQIKFLYSSSPQKKDKQKNSYSKEDIKTISSIIQNKIEFTLNSKKYKFNDNYTLNFDTIFDSKLENHQNVDINSLLNAYEIIGILSFFGEEAETKLKEKFKNLDNILEIFSLYINHKYKDIYFEDYENLYKNIKQRIVKKQKIISKYFEEELKKQYLKENKKIANLFEELENINSRVSVKLEIR